ncbi:hypothetical protein HY383_02210 [Candidatus Daviesbacteria bacterium]|nr:hypothetical protein [Candidatus Daviesbacteria bacterium]
MTLILTALCKNGICVCADKRNRRRYKNGLVQNNDGFNKIYKFASIPLMIFNHGVNEFGNKSWEKLCFEYENSNQWNNKSLKHISEDFRNLIEKDVHEQLKRNMHIFPNEVTAFFDLCGKNSQNNSYEVHELFWSIDTTGLHFSSSVHRGFVRSGDGKECLDDYIVQNGKMNTIDYWDNLDITQARNTLRELFTFAVEEKKRLGKDEFSDDFDIECVTE